MIDILIKNGQVVDGTGAPRVQADVAIDGGRIAAVEQRIDEPTSIPLASPMCW